MALCCILNVVQVLQDPFLLISIHFFAPPILQQIVVMATLAPVHRLAPAPFAVAGITAAWIFAVTRLCDYLSTVPFPKAMAILSLTRSGRDLGDLGNSLISALPRTFFTQPPFALHEIRFMFDKGAKCVRMVRDPNKQLPWPTPLDPVAGPIAEAALPTDAVPSRLRSLNSFMVFRSRCALPMVTQIYDAELSSGYVAGLFPKIPQKKKSPFISEMWVSEPLKAQWEVMARAYTFLRDNFDLPDLTLAEFTGRAAVQFGIPAPRAYLAMLGWEIQTSWANGKLEYILSCRREPGSFTLDIECISMEDLIKPYRKDPNVPLQECGQWPLENAIAIKKVYADEDPINLVVSDDGVFENLDVEWTFEEILGPIDPSLHDPGDIIYQSDLEIKNDLIWELESQMYEGFIEANFPSTRPF